MRKNKQKQNPLLLLLFVVGGFLIIAYILNKTVGTGSTNKDILSRKVDYRQQKKLTYNLNNLPTIGVSSINDVYDMFGTNVKRRLSFDTTRTKTIGSDTFQYDQILEYTYTGYTRTTSSNDSTKIVNDQVTNRTYIVVFLLDSTVTHFGISYEEKKNGELELIPEKSRNYVIEKNYIEAAGHVWPGSISDINAYMKQEGMPTQEIEYYEY